MTLVERLGEALARQCQRRQLLKRAAVAVFGAVAAWSVEGFRGNSALAASCGYVTEGDCDCSPPDGLYCRRLDPSFCAGSACAGGCDWDESYRYAGACWCSATCQYSSGTGYYQCCDCTCYGQQCGCREFIPVGPSAEPEPERPGGLPLPPGPPPPPSPPPPPACFPFCD
jgi:hypothetical protein